MRISFVLSSLELSGGVKVIIEVANRLQNRGHQVTLISPKSQLDLAILKEICPGIMIKESSLKLPDHSNPFLLFIQSVSLAVAVPKSDFVFSTYTPTTVPVFFATYLLHRGRPIWYFQDYAEMFSDRPIERWLLRHAIKWHYGAIAISEFCRSELSKFGTRKPIELVPDGISHPEIFHPLLLNDDGNSDKAKKMIVYLGDDRPRKGMRDFLKAAELVKAQIPDASIWIISKADPAISINIPYKFLKRPSDSELAKIYQSCAVFVSASWVEGFGLPPLEAMACSAPVVATDSKGVREYARHLENCYLVPPHHPELLAEGIIAVFQNIELANRFRINGPKTAQRFDWETSVDRLEQILTRWSTRGISRIVSS